MSSMQESKWDVENKKPKTIIISTSLPFRFSFSIEVVFGEESSSDPSATGDGGRGGET